MAENKYLDSAGVKYLWDKAKGMYVQQEEGKGLSSNDYSDADKQKVAAAITEHQDISGKVDKEAGKGLSSNDYTNEEKDKLAGLENYELPNASTENLGGVKVGEGLSIDENGVLKTVYNPEMPVEWDDIHDVPTTLEGYGITDAVSDSELADAINDVNDSISALDDKIDEVKEEVSKAYHFKGSVNTRADLDNIQNPHEGDVYNVKEDGKNYAWVVENSQGFWDDLGGVFEIEAISDYELDIITGSASSEEALVELISDGGEVFLGKSMTLSQPLDVTKDTVLDLSGNTLSGSMEGYALVADGAKLTLKNGNVSVANRVAQAQNGGEVIIESGVYNAGDVALSAIGAGSKVTFNGGELTAVEGGIGSFDGAAIEVNGGTIKGTDNFPLFTNGTSGRGGNTIVFNDGYLEGNITSNGYEACGVYIANNDTFVMNGGKIKANDGCGILMRAGTVTINGGEVEVNKKDSGSHSPGWVGDNKTKMSASAVIYHESANYPGKAGMSLTITGGSFKGADHALEILSNEATPNVTVTGGTFVPDFPEV